MITDNIKGIIGIVILILAIVVIAVPILDNVTYTETEENASTGYATDNLTQSTFTLSSGIVKNNGVDVPGVNNLDWVILSDTLSVVVLGNNYFVITDHAAEVHVQVPTFTVNADGTYTYTANQTTHTQEIGPNAMMRAIDGTIGVYKNTSFIIDKDKGVLSFGRITSTINIGGTNFAVWAIVSGTMDNLKVTGLTLVLSVDDTIFIDPADARASISEESLTQKGIKTYELSATPKINLSFDYGGTEYTISTNYAYAIGAPLDYTVVPDTPINAMIGIAPLLMLAGVIIATIALVIQRRS